MDVFGCTRVLGFYEELVNRSAKEEILEDEAAGKTTTLRKC
mgnify:CR=1 FL=1|jgi:hypothetical protein